MYLYLHREILEKINTVFCKNLRDLYFIHCIPDCCNIA